MGIEIKITNSEIQQNSTLLTHLNLSKINDLKVEIDNIKVKDSSKVLEDLTDTDIDDIVSCMKEYTQSLNKQTTEFQNMQNILTEIKTKKAPVRNILEKHLPDLLIGTFSKFLTEWLTTK